VFLINRPVIHC